MECRICKGKRYTNLWYGVVCDRCGAVYNPDTLEITDFEKAKLWMYFNNIIKNIDDEAKREYVRGLFEGYYMTLVNTKWKKAREWAIYQIIDLLNKLNKL